MFSSNAAGMLGGSTRSLASYLTPTESTAMNYKMPQREFGKRVLYDLFGPIGEGGARSAPVAFQTLFDILSSRGQTDPTWMNLMSQGIARGGEGAQLGIDRMLSGRGWENSGVGAALKQASTGATENRQAMFKAEQARLAEERKRADLELLLKMFMQPSLDVASLAMGQGQKPSGASGLEQIGGLVRDLGPLALAFGI